MYIKINKIKYLFFDFKYKNEKKKVLNLKIKRNHGVRS